MADKYLDSMYNDFFGPGSGGDGKPPVFDDPKKGEEIEKKVHEDFERVREGKDIVGPEMKNDIKLEEVGDNAEGST